MFIPYNLSKKIFSYKLEPIHIFCIYLLVFMNVSIYIYIYRLLYADYEWECTYIIIYDDSSVKLI